LDPERAKDSKLAGAAAKLESVQTYGGIIVDTMGFGKTYTSLLFLAVYAQSLSFSNTQSHRPALCIAPSGIVLHQWQEAICKFPSLVLIIAYGERATASRLSSNWVSATAMREAPHKLTNWPAHLRYVFDKSNKAASNVVILTSYDTWASRTLQTKRSITKGGRQKKTFESRWANVIGPLLLDEGHKLRHRRTKIYASVRQLNAEIIWFLTATPVINDSLVC
jgi:SNF2 family DNA or RNA helicase